VKPCLMPVVLLLDVPQKKCTGFRNIHVYALCASAVLMAMKLMCRKVRMIVC
jgi:hypothetical protein